METEKITTDFPKAGSVIQVLTQVVKDEISNLLTN